VQFLKSLAIFSEFHMFRTHLCGPCEQKYWRPRLGCPERFHLQRTPTRAEFQHLERLGEDRLSQIIICRSHAAHRFVKNQKRAEFIAYRFYGAEITLGRDDNSGTSAGKDPGDCHLPEVRFRKKYARYSTSVKSSNLSHPAQNPVGRAQV
jgi:hypothetical protein